MPEIQVITFDAAGTLMVPDPSVGESYAKVLRDRGLAADPEAIERNFRATFEATQTSQKESAFAPKVYWKSVVAGSLAGFCPVDELDSVFEELWEFFGRGDSWRLLEGAQSTLKELRDRGFRMAVLSNNDTRLKNVLRDLGVSAFFERVFVSFELGQAKPDPAIFRSVEKALGLPSSAFLHVGDDQAKDADGARNAGWKAILLTKQKGSGLRAHGLPEVPAILEKLAA